MLTLSDIMPLLIEKSEARKLEWERLSGTAFVASLGDTSVEVGKSKDGQVYIVIRNEAGDVLENANWGMLFPPADEQLKYLVELARRRALQLDESLEGLKKRLNEL